MNLKFSEMGKIVPLMPIQCDFKTKNPIKASHYAAALKIILWLEAIEL